MNPKPKNEIKKLNLRDFWKKLWGLLSFSHKQIRNLMIFIMFIEIINLSGPYLLKLIIDNITNFSPEKIGKLIFLIVAMFLINQLTSVLSYNADRKIFSSLTATLANLSSRAHKKMVYLDLGYHEKENTGNKIVKIQRGLDRIENLFGNFFWDVAPTIFQIVFTAVALFVVDWRFGLIIMIFVPIFIFFTLKLNRSVYPLRRNRFTGEEKAAGVVTQSIININTVKSFVQEMQEWTRADKFREEVRTTANKEFRTITNYNLIRNLVIDLGRILILFFGIYLVWKGGITIGSLVFVYTISEKALISLYRISRLYDRIMESGEAINRLYELFQEEPKVKNPENGIKPERIAGEIKFKNVSFRYEGSKLHALEGINLKIISGCVTALVGPSGGGKTTLVRLIYRHYDPQEGEVLVDDKNVKEYDLYTLRKFMAIVPQEVEIFNDSVKNNIAYADPNIDMQEIEAAAKIANAEEFISKLKDGYDTLVGERGIKLSGGQRQRIGIARAILANPRILIFDEATSNLDSYSEKLIQEAMDKVSKDRTVIIIAHRLSTVRKADKVVVLEKGRVAEVGSHIELSKLEGGIYKKLLNLQKMGEIS